MGSLLRELGLLLFFLHVLGVTTRSTMELSIRLSEQMNDDPASSVTQKIWEMTFINQEKNNLPDTISSNTGPDVNNIDQSVELNNTEATAVSPGGKSTLERIFGITRFYETSTVTPTPRKSETSLAFETRTANKAETGVTKSFSPKEMLIKMNSLDKTETAVLLESTDPTASFAPIVSEAGTTKDKSCSHADILTMTYPMTQKEIITMETLVTNETWSGTTTMPKMDWKTLNDPPLFPHVHHQNHGKHRYHTIGHHSLTSSIPENYKTTKIPTFTDVMPTTDTFTKSEISNLFWTTALEETSGITISPETETVITKEIIPFSLLFELTETVDIVSNTIEREENPIKTTTLPETLVRNSPNIKSTLVTTNLIDTFPTYGSMQEIETTTAVDLTIMSTKTEPETTTLETDFPVKTFGGVVNSLQSNTTDENKTLTDNTTEMMRTGAKPSIQTGTTMTIDSSTEEGTVALSKAISYPETSASSSSTEEDSSVPVETLTIANGVIMAVSKTIAPPNTIETLGTTGHTVETAVKLVTDTLSTTYIPTEKETQIPIKTTAFPEVPSTAMMSTEKRSTQAKFTSPDEFSDKVHTTTKGTTSSGINSSTDKTSTSDKIPAMVSTTGKPVASNTSLIMSPNNPNGSNHEGGFLLVRLVVSSSMDLTDLKVAKKLLNQLHKDLEVQVPYTQISLLQVTKG